MNYFTGKINEFETKNLLLLSKLDRLNVTVAEDKEIQINTIKGLERLGDSLASIKVDMMNKDEEEDMKALENKVHYNLCRENQYYNCFYRLTP